jgi:hypothetical protein
MGRGMITIEPIYQFEIDDRSFSVPVPATKLICDILEVKLYSYAIVKYQLLSNEGKELFWGVIRMEGDCYNLWNDDNYIYEWTKKELNL